MRKISIMIPCYNEQDNVWSICKAVQAVFERELSEYNYEILFIDNKSKDDTRKILRILCKEDTRVKAIFNMKNFGQFNSPYYGLCQTTGDCTILLCADFQDPVELIPTMVHEWEKGHKVISMIKTSSKENPLRYWLRGMYYKLIRAMSDVQQIEHFTGFGLYDRSFIEVLKTLDDPTPFLRGIVAEYAPDHLEISYEQQKRKAGKTSNNFFSLFDAAMLSFTSYTKAGLRFATFAGFIVSGVSFLIAIFYLIQKLNHWDQFIAGNAPILIGVFFLGGIQLFFIGLLGEYILSMNTRIIHRPLVIEEERINFTETDDRVRDASI
ncbi:glycosyltransferase family 2 protein [Harryflintia acetispora]|uniref:Glycosyltransferase involved in cell wall biosynthesis n=1 Tax=Harryflintia acetispora TaxID=1849041 RepID=A0A9X8Y7Z8_9FIRM|nr:glycosyltransferase family 2 protein [Harryflintia acetispora]TCL43009.1 glycosyltransferase involved in cell wall biosynthesis [Harryflintia acetispora]